MSWRSYVGSAIDRHSDELTERERKILWLYYDFENRGPLERGEIGSLFNLERHEVEKIRREALAKLRGVPEVEAYWQKLDLDTAPRGDVTAVRIDIEPGDASPADLAAFYTALSDLYRAYGGSGLVFRSTAEVSIIAGAV